MKQVIYTVAVVLRKKLNDKEFLIVKRPTTDPDLGGHWGLPATTLQPGELPENGIRRICKEKLGCEIEPVRFVGIMFQKRNTYDIFLIDIEAILKGKKLPDVTKAKASGTKYIEQKWTSDPLEIMASAKAGSCCSSIFLTDQGLLDRGEWVGSLEGSNIVA